jgi:hypothetical protein
VNGRVSWLPATPAPVPTVLYADPGAEVGLLAIDDDAVYFTDLAASPGAIVRVPKTGGSVETVVTIPNAAGGALAVDARTLYWWTGNARRVRPRRRAPLRKGCLSFPNRCLLAR